MLGYNSEQRNQSSHHINNTQLQAEMSVLRKGKNKVKGDFITKEPSRLSSEKVCSEMMLEQRSEGHGGASKIKGWSWWYLIILEGRKNVGGTKEASVTRAQRTRRV